MNPKADFFFNKTGQWHNAFAELRRIVLDCGLNEELKWGHPCYTLGKKNVVLIHGFKAYCAMLFMKGALLTDKRSILVQQTKNVQAARQIRFSNASEIIQLEPTLKDYIREAIKFEELGAKVEMKKTADFSVPEEFSQKLNENTLLKEAFQSLTPGRQRAYLFYFSGAKQSKTRQARIEKYIPQILTGKGLDD